jgi:uncharacterized RmlC-like cupin family protein
MTEVAAKPETSNGMSTLARPGALSEAQMAGILVRSPNYRTLPGAPAQVHALTVEQLWSGRLNPLMAAADASGRFSGAALTCPPTACTGLLTLSAGAQSKAWRNADAIENIFCFEGRVEITYGARLEQTLVLERFDMVSVPAGVRHRLTNVDEGETRLLMVLSVPATGSYDAIFSTDEVDIPLSVQAALGVRLDGEPGVEVDVETLGTRVTRFDKLVPYKKDLNRTGGLPTEATESLSSGSVFTLIVPEGHVGRSRTAPMYGNQGLYMAIGECRSGDDGPPAHAHMDTQESFFVLDGTFDIFTGFDNESVVSVKPGDLVAVPKQVMRTFRNTTGRPARMIAIIQGPDRMRDTVAYSRRIGTEFAGRFGAEIIEAYKQIGMTFDAEDRLCQ